MTEPRHPLTWPTGWPRTPAADRRSAQFSKQSRAYSERRLTTHDGIKRVMEAIRSFTRAGRDWVIDPESVIISTNMPTRIDGGIRADARRPDDVGVAVFWTDADDRRKCMAADHYDTVGDNLAAVAATLEALRAIERHGGARLLDRAFTGFAALPAPTGPRWWAVFGVDQNEKNDAVRDVYRTMRGRGTDADQARVNVAWDQFKAERGLS